MVHRIKNREVPRYLIKYFVDVKDTHRYNTRGSSTDFVPYKFNSGMGKSTFLYSAAVMWNGLPKKLKSIVSKDTFKSSHKRWLNEKRKISKLLLCVPFAQMLLENIVVLYYCIILSWKGP